MGENRVPRIHLSTIILPSINDGSWLVIRVIHGFQINTKWMCIKKIFVLIRFMDLTDLDMLQSGLRRYWSLAFQYRCICKFVDTHLKQGIASSIMLNGNIYQNMMINHGKSGGCFQSSMKIRGMSSYEKAGNWDLPRFLPFHAPFWVRC